MDINLFRQTLQTHLKKAGILQEELALAMILQPAVLSRKLNGTNKAYLNKKEVKLVVLILVEKQVISKKIEAVELLTLAGFFESSFSSEEWRSAPLNKLEQWQTNIPYQQAHQPNKFNSPIRSDAPGSTESGKNTLIKNFQSPNNLPLNLSALIGREKELTYLAAKYSKAAGEEGSRLITLTGIGGIGKTRLALQIARNLLLAPLPLFTDGIWLVRLESVIDETLVPQQVASILELDEPEPERPLIAVIASYFQDKSALLILDNCEHLINACSKLIVYLLSHCSHLQIMTTSREILRLSGETIFKVSSLAFPDPAMPLAKIEEFSAIVLFKERALASTGNFALTSENYETVVQICQYLVGIPLAIELAASRIKVLSVQQIAESLKRNYEVLASNSRQAPLRQRTLRATIDWSYNLLTPKEKLLFRRLSVFVGGWDLEAAELVIADGEDLALNEILELTSNLIDASLVIKEEIFEKARYHLLDIFRQYATAELVKSGEQLAISKAHSLWCLNLAEMAEPHLRGSNQTFWLDRLEADHFNFRAAMGWLLAQKDTALEDGLRLSGALGWFWWTRGYIREGIQWLEGFLAEIVTYYPTGELDSNLAVQAKALHMAGVLLQIQGDYKQATSKHEQSLALRKRLSDNRGISYSLHNLGVLAQYQNNYFESKQLYAESLLIKRELGNLPIDIAPTLHNLGLVERLLGNYADGLAMLEASLVLRRGIEDKAGIASCLDNLGAFASDERLHAKATELHRESLKLREELGDKYGIALTKYNQAIVELQQLRYDEARKLFNESKDISADLGDKQGRAETIYGLGTLAQAEGDYLGAKGLYVESMLLSQAIGDRENLAYCLEAIAELAVAQLQPERAARLFGFAENLRRIMGSKIYRQEQLLYNTSQDELNKQLEYHQLELIWSIGSKMSLEEAVKLAQSD